MSHKHEAQGQYSEGIRVKISEKYKPPPRISLPTTYTQRVNCNKQLEDSMPKYEFLLEKTVKERVKEWRAVRTMMQEERKIRLEKAREELAVKNEETELNEQEECNNYNLPASNSVYLGSVTTSQTYSSVGEDNLLMPTHVSYSNILKPIPLKNEFDYRNKPADKSPFNISDFEADTSSPFDNMELKSINDLEELAQVLKIDDHNYHHLRNNYQQPLTSASNQAYSTFNTNNSNQFNYSSASSAGVSYPQQNNTYNYYNLPHDTQSFHVPATYYNSPVTAETASSSIAESKKSQFRSVPDIVKALESELDNTVISKNYTHSDNIIKNNFVPEPARPKSTDSVGSKPKKPPRDNLDDPYYKLPKTLQELSKNISSMGFPLSRVARTCLEYGDDQKKVVEHLLGLTQLLDLGFSEKDASIALILCDNDRDKAIDSLVYTK